MREVMVAALAVTVACAGDPAPLKADPGVEDDVGVEVQPVLDLPKRAAVPEVREPPKGFVSLGEAVPGLALDVRYATANNFTGAPLPGYIPGVLWVHPSTAVALASVQASLEASGLRLRVFDAYRPTRASKAMVVWAQASGRTDLLHEGYIARHSNHARGNTVDVTLESATGDALDMGTAWDTFSPESHYAAARAQPMAHRRTLRRAMVRAGFKPYAREWWHFSLPDPTGLPRLDVPYDRP